MVFVKASEHKKHHMSVKYQSFGLFYKPTKDVSGVLGKCCFWQGNREDTPCLDVMAISNKQSPYSVETGDPQHYRNYFKHLCHYKLVWAAAA